MTAEVAILNRSAVALAADSAVTIGGGHKTYNSANKLFGLSKYEPVGVMVYGTASLDRVPWETILKECRRELGRTSFPTLRDYAEYLLAYLTDNTVLFPKEAQVAGVKDMATAFLGEAKATAFRRAAEKGELLEKALEACFRAFNQSLAKCAFTSGYSSENAHAST
ncbi:MAG: hypothetical protein JW741_09490, partial [Sedimentisphaerales bacterium]|nr:hypothetical protein [Sedimentisphaerales bacterium]